MFNLSDCTTQEIYPSPFSVRRFNSDLRPALRTPHTEIKKRFYSPENIRALTKQAVQIADKKGVISARVAELDVRKAADRAYDEWRGSLATEQKKRFDQIVALNKPGAGAIRLNRERELQILNARTLKHVKLVVYEKLLQEKRARILRVGVHSQAGLISRPHRPADREQFVGKLSQKGIPATGVKESGLVALGNLI